MKDLLKAFVISDLELKAVVSFSFTKHYHIDFTLLWCIVF